MSERSRPKDTPRPDFDRRRRWLATTSTWLLKATALLTYDVKEAGSEDERWLIGYDTERLVSLALDVVEGLAPLLNDEQVGEVAERAQKVARGLRDRVRAEKLEQLAGRTPEEAEAFTRKADELRRRLA